MDQHKPLASWLHAIGPTTIYENQGTAWSEAPSQPAVLGDSAVQVREHLQVCRCARILVHRSVLRVFQTQTYRESVFYQTFFKKMFEDLQGPMQ